MPVDFDVIVVGGGAMGSAAAYHLARAGVSTLLLEQFEIGHENGASHGDSRIIRLSYDHPAYIKLARSSYKLWAELEGDAGERVLTETGMIDISMPGHPGMQACLDSMRVEDVDYEEIERDEVMRRYPEFRLKEGMFGVFQKDAGILSPRQCVPLMARMAAKHGCTVVDRSKVLEMDLADAYVSIRTQDKTYQGRKLIVCAGPWAGTVLQQVGLRLPLTVTQEAYVFFKPENPDLFKSPRFPIFAFYGENRFGSDIEFYGFPIFGHDGVKIAQHHAGPIVSADDRSFEVPAHTVDKLRSYLREYIPQAEGEIIHGMTCLYTVTPDRHFVVDRLESHPHVTIAAGFSGHGFKFAILIGKILQELTVEGGTEHAIDLFGLSRLQSSGIRQ